MISSIYIKYVIYAGENWKKVFRKKKKKLEKERTHAVSSFHHLVSVPIYERKEKYF